MADLPIGTVILSKNRIKSENKTPGIWNHCQILVDANSIVESQEGPGVILTPLSEWLKRDYIFGYIYPKDKNVGILAAAYARSLIGTPYNKLSSIYREPKNSLYGENCVSLVRDSYSHATKQNLLIRRPDNLLKFTDIFTDKLS